MEDHKRIRVLIADDHRIFREALRMLLAAECVVIAEASDGEEAVAKAAQLKPQVVVMDLGMRGIGGLLAARRITRADPSCRVLALSQYDDEEYVLEALGEAGCAGYVVKTDAAAELLCAVRAVNSGRRYLSPTIAPIVLARMRNGGKANASRAAEPTPREREVLKLIGEGASTKEVALRLGISVKTAQVHRDNLKQKLELRSTAAMVRYAIKHKLIELNACALSRGER
jgi:two-component system, NarL family, response regulator NreC